MLRVSVNDVPAFDVQVSDASGFWTFDQNDTDYPFYLDPLVIDTQRAIDVTVNNGDVLEVELYEKDGEWENIGVGSEARPDAFYHDMTLTFIGDCGSA